MNEFINEIGDNVSSFGGSSSVDRSLYSEGFEVASDNDDNSIYSDDIGDYLRSIDSNVETLVQNESVVSETVEDVSISDLNKTLQWTNVLFIILILYIVGRSITNRVRLL